MAKLIKPYVIAEIGGNHDSNINYMFEGILEAKKSGADAIKFQYYNAENLIHPKTPLMKNVKKAKTSDKNQFDRYKRLSVPKKLLPKLYKYAKKINLDFGCSIFDHKDVGYVSKYTDFFKIASGDINYFPLLEKISQYKKKVIISSGLSNLKIIDRAFKILKKNKLIILHCICKYPSLEIDYNLLSLKAIIKKYGSSYKYGLSDHTKSSLVACLSIGLGATYIEKHFLPNEKVKNTGDYSLSLNPKELKNFINDLNYTSKVLGEPIKKKFDCEIPFEKSLRRSPYSSRSIKIGQKLKKNDIKYIRPYSKIGIENHEIKKFIGRKLKQNLKINSLIKKTIF